MPGHKRRKKFLPRKLLSYDLTELPDMDVLTGPTGIIRKFHEKTAKIYHADESRFVINGTSGGLISAICAVCKENQPIMIPRNAHASVYHALVLSGAHPLYYSPEITRNGLFGGVLPETFANMPFGTPVVVTSPTYEGFVSDIDEISKIVHERGGMLIVDEAHGAHFAFHDFFPKSAVESGADIVVNSLHKTLPALSQCSVLHIKGSRVDIGRVDYFLSAMQTTSPSYIFMAATDFMLDKLYSEPQHFEKYIRRLKKIRVKLQEISDSMMRLVNWDRGQFGIHDTDAGKLLFSCPSFADTAELSKILRNKYKIEPEYALGNLILFMTSVADTKRGFNMLLNAVEGINSDLCCLHENLFKTSKYKLPDMQKTPREAMFCETETVEWDKAVGRIAAELIAPCPPGTAILVPGEKIPPDLKKVKEYIRVTVER